MRDDQDDNLPDHTPPTITFRGPIAFLNHNTTDRRRIAHLTWRDLPLPVLYASGQWDGHAGAVPVGRLTTVEIADDGAVIATIESNQLPAIRHACGVDLDSVVVTLADIDGDPLAADAHPTDAIELVVEARLMALTVYASALGAFPDAHIEPI